jgi:type II secretory pathway pseudopilin PulG
MNSGLPSSKSSSGQVLLIVLLVISVLLVVGLSVVSRSVTDIKISQQSQEAARALWVAQAGLENAIRANAGVSGTNESLNVSYDVVQKDVGGNEFVFPDKINANESVTLWLIPHDESTGDLAPPADATTYGGPRRVSLYWAEAGMPALEATLLYKDALNQFQFKRYTYDPDDSRIPSQTHFAAAVRSSTTIEGKTLLFNSGQIDFSAGVVPYFLRLRLLFNSTPQFIGAKAEETDRPFPKQGNCFVSTAEVLESRVTRKLSECRLWQTTPPIFDHLLFSGGDIQ